MEECEFCVDGSKCLKCHMEAKQELPIRRAYRQEKERHSIEDLEEKNDNNNLFIKRIRTLKRTQELTRFLELLFPRNVPLI